MLGPRQHTSQTSHLSENQQLLDGLFDPYVMLSAVRDEHGTIIDFVFTQANSAACEFNHVPHEQLVGSRLLELLPGHRDSELFRLYVDVVETGETLRLNGYAYNHELRGGVTHRFDIQAVRIGDGLSFTWRDVTAQYVTAAEPSLPADTQADYYRAIAENSLDIVLRTDPAGLVTWISPSVRDVLGWQPSEIVGELCWSFLYEDEASGMAVEPPMEFAVPGQRSLHEVRIRTQHGSWRWMRAYIRPVLDIEGLPAGLTITLRDIGREVETRSKLAYARRHDPLTGLPNRQAAVERIASLLASSTTDRLWVLCVGIDGLDDIYQAITESAGEQVLAVVAAALRGSVGTGDWVFRGAGNEYLIVLPHSESERTATEFAQRVIHQAHRPIEVGGTTVDVTVSIGIARTMPVDDPQVVLRRATAAMLQASQRGRSQCGFLDVNLSNAVRNRLVTAGELQSALTSRAIRPWLQPLVSLQDKKVQGYEALARWVTSDGHVMPPATFIPIAESTGLVEPLDNLMIARSVQILATLPEHLHMAVNCSATTLANPNFVDRVSRVLEVAGVAPQRLYLEVTETSLLDVTPAIQESMHALHARGITWWVDDFGTGYSSLAHLRDLPVQGLKLDQSFTAALTQDDSTTARLTKGLFGLASGLHLRTIAEGVETAEQAALLSAQGWEWGQGWLFGKPAPPPNRESD